MKYPEFDGTQNCVNADVEIFFYEDWEGEGTGARRPKNKKDFTAAKIMCSTCPFLEPCFLWALHHERYGFWGGTTEEERAKMRTVKGIEYVNPLKDSLYVKRKNR